MCIMTKTNEDNITLAMRTVNFRRTRCFVLFIDIARIVCGAGSMKLSSVRLSVRPSHHSAATRRCGGFAAVCPAATRYRPIAARPALSSKGERCRVVNSTQLNSTQNYGRRCLTPLSPHRNCILS